MFYTVAIININSTKLALRGHNSQNHRIGVGHSIATNIGKVADRAVYIVVDDALYRLNTAVVHRHKSRHYSCRDT